MRERNNKSVGRKIVLVWVLCAFPLAVDAQTFNSGSTGVDGDLIINTPGVTTYTTAPQGGGNIYNFKTIQISTGSTLRLSGAVFPNPLYFLAQGAVTISGTIDLSGQNGSTTLPGDPAQRGGPTTPGAGGYGGGAPGYGSNPPEAGLGPAGGAANGGCGGFTGNQFLVPLVGGSGGGGYNYSGGAGGGALLIASSVSITINGTITANGGSYGWVYGSGGPSGSGAGGAIRLVSGLIAGSGSVTAGGGGVAYGYSCGATTTAGIVRLEAYQITYTGFRTIAATPVGLFLPSPTSQPSIVVTSVGGVPVATSPTGSFVMPDVTVNSSSPLTVVIQATNVPPGTTATLYTTTENFPDQKIISNPFAGTMASSTATATITLQPGYSLGYVTATWTQ